MSTANHECHPRGGFITCLVLSILLSIGFGYSVAAYNNQEALIQLAAQQVKERDSLRRKHSSDVNYLRGLLAQSKAIIVRQSDQFAELGLKSSEGTKKAIDLMDKKLNEVDPQ